MRFVIYGAGAIGGLVAARLMQAGNEVVAIARGAHLAAMRADGLTVVSGGATQIVNVPVADGPEGIDWRTQGDVVLLAMKGQHTRQALERLSAATGPETPLLCLQNGVANERDALRWFRSVYGVLVVCPATFLEPGVVSGDLSPVEGILDVGRYPAGADDMARTAAHAFASATFSARVLDDVMRWKYAKLLGNLGNVVQALFASDEGSEAIVRAARNEGVAALQAAGIDFVSEEEFRERGTGILDRFAGGRAGGSTWQSIARGAGSIETDYLNGEIVLVGRRHGVPTPVNEILQRRAAEHIRSGAPPGSASSTDLLDALSL